MSTFTTMAAWSNPRISLQTDGFRSIQVVNCAYHLEGGNVRFIGEWCRLLFLPLTMLKGVAGMAKILIPLVPASVVSALGLVLVYFESVPWWSVPIAVLISFWLALTAGMAIERSTRPTFSIGPLKAHPGAKVEDGPWGFYFVLQNGKVPAAFSGQVTDMTEGNHNPPTKGRWRRKPEAEHEDLNALGNAQFGVIGFLWSKAGNPRLHIWPEPVTKDVPLGEQNPVKLKVVMVASCKTGDKEDREYQTMTYTIVPDPGTNSYMVVETLAMARFLPWLKKQRTVAQLPIPASRAPSDAPVGPSSSDQLPL